MERHIAIVPARAGSKAVKNKNILTLNNKTLIRIAVEGAINSRVFDSVIVTSDYPKQRLGLDNMVGWPATKLMVINRPEHLCTDEAEMVGVIKHVISEIGNAYTWIWLLQPSSPFRSQEDYREIKRVLDTGNWECIIAVKPVKEHSNRMYTMGPDGELFPLRFANFNNRETLLHEFFRSGNFYVMKRENVIAHDKMEDIMKKRRYGYIMGNYKKYPTTNEDLRRSMLLGTNIDMPEDWETAKLAVLRGDIKV